MKWPGQRERWYERHLWGILWWTLGLVGLALAWLAIQH